MSFANSLNNNQIVHRFLIQTPGGLFSFILCRMAFLNLHDNSAIEGTSERLRREFAFAELYGASLCYASIQAKHYEYCRSSLDATKNSDSAPISLFCGFLCV